MPHATAIRAGAASPSIIKTCSVVMAKPLHLLSAYCTPSWAMMQEIKMVIYHKKMLDRQACLLYRGGGNETHSHLARSRYSSRTT